MISFTPRCTLPSSDPVGFVNGPNIRSTMDIVWACASVIILSTWSVLHLNVPPDLKATSMKERIRKSSYLLGRKLAWMGVMIAFPEYLTGISIANLFSAWVNHQRLTELAKLDGVPWALTHTILANIGGIAIRFTPLRVATDAAMQPPSPIELSLLRSHTAPIGLLGRASTRRANRGVFRPLLHHVESGMNNSSNHATDTGASSTELKPKELPAFIARFDSHQKRALQGLGKIPWLPLDRHIQLAAIAEPHSDWAQKSLGKYQSDHVAPLQGDVWILDSNQLAFARASKVISRLPAISTEEIEDRSKIDGLLRLVALIQVLWFIAQLIVRRLENFSSSALEFSTVAFASCAIIIYVTEWHKPKDIGVPFYIDTNALVSPDTFSRIADAAPITFLPSRKYYIAQSCVHQVIEGRYCKKHVDRLVILTSIVSISIYGGIHLFAWNLQFPTPTEQLLWRVSALTVGIAPTVSALLVLMEDLISHRTDRLSKWSVSVLAPAYVTARLFIIAESFRSLYYMDQSAFMATQTVNLPHFG